MAVRARASARGTEPLGLLEGAAQRLDLGALPVEREGELVVVVEAAVGQKPHARAEIARRRLVGGGGLGLLPAARLSSAAVAPSAGEVDDGRARC